MTQKIRQTTLIPNLETKPFSTTEQLTGRRWIDDKPIFEKVVDLGALPNATTKNVAHGITGIGTLIDMRGGASDGANVRLPLPLVTTTAAQISLVFNGANIDVVTATDRSGFTGHAILRYTKA